MSPSIDYRDTLVIAFYLGFMLLLGFVFRRFSRDTSDYFRGGGSMLWWLAGPSGMMSALSAWSFTGAAGAIYEMGPLVAIIYVSNILALIVVFLFSCERFRRMRVVTYAEGIRRRYGGATEQFYVWIGVPVGILFAGVQLNAVSVFFAAVFGTQLVPTIVVVSAVVISMAMLGGAWAVVAGDFLQLLMTLLVLVLASFFALRLPEVGGLDGLLRRMPAAHGDWSLLMRPEIVLLWGLAYFVFAVADFNNMSNGAARFLMVKDGPNARRAALTMMGCFLLITLTLLIPPIAATIVFPDLAARFPQLRNPNEAAFVAVCFRAMPPGVIGLLAAGIFAVAMASMDTGLNRNAGVFVRNFYLRVLRPSAGERELLVAAKLCTLLFGLAVMGIACAFSSLSRLSLFGLTQALGSLLGFPLAVPMVLGILVRRAPAWAGWSTAAVGIATAAVIEYGGAIGLYADLRGWLPLSAREIVHLGFALRVLAVVSVGCGWFFLVRRFAPRDRQQDPATPFFADLDTPVERDGAPNPDADRTQYLTMGRLCSVYGTGIALLALLPNVPAGRLSFLFCGGTIAFVGACLLFRGSRRPSPCSKAT